MFVPTLDYDAIIEWCILLLSDCMSVWHMTWCALDGVLLHSVTRTCMYGVCHHANRGIWVFYRRICEMSWCAYPCFGWCSTDPTAEPQPVDVALVLQYLFNFLKITHSWRYAPSSSHSFHDLTQLIMAAVSLVVLSLKHLTLPTYPTYCTMDCSSSQSFIDVEGGEWSFLHLHHQLHCVYAKSKLSPTFFVMTNQPSYSHHHNFVTQSRIDQSRSIRKISQIIRLPVNQPNSLQNQPQISRKETPADLESHSASLIPDKHRG